MLKEFKEFALKGNMIDLAVGVIIGGAFNSLVTSLVENIITEPVAAGFSLFCKLCVLFVLCRPPGDSLCQ